jgi:hypothetical protein
MASSQILSPPLKFTRNPGKIHQEYQDSYQEFPGIDWDFTRTIPGNLPGLPGTRNEPGITCNQDFTRSPDEFHQESLNHHLMPRHPI